MSKPIPESVVDDFIDTCCSLDDGDTISSLDLPDEDEDGNELKWEYHASNYQPDDSYDIYELFEAASRESDLVFEEDGYDSFFVTRQGDDEDSGE